MAATEAQLKILCDDSDNALLDTAAYTAIIAIESNVYRAAALACRAISAQFAEKVKISAPGPVSIENQQKFEHYQALADKYDFRANQGGGGSGNGYKPRLTGISKDEMKTQREDTDRIGSAFPEGFDAFVDPDPEADYERVST